MGLSVAMGLSPNGWFLLQNPTNMDDLGVRLFQEKVGFPQDPDSCHEKGWILFGSFKGWEGIARIVFKNTPILNNLMIWGV